MIQSQTARSLLLGALLGTAAALTAGAETETLTLAPESSEKIDVPEGVRKMFISNPGIIDARPDDDGFAVLVTAIKQGKAELRISRMAKEDLIYKIEVEPELQDLADEVKVMVEDIEGINIKIVGDKLILDGELLTQGAKRRAAEVAKAFAGRVIDLTTLDLVGYNRTVKRALEKEIATDTVVVKVEGERVVLTGSVPSQSELDRVKEIAKRRAENSTIMLTIKP